MKKKRVDFRKKALNDINEAIDWYEERKTGLGVEFYGEVQNTVNKIKENPNQFAERYHKLRAAQTKHFPYFVYYLIEKIRILIVAIIHTSRDTSAILKDRE